MSGASLSRRARASYTMEFKLELVEKSVQPGACVAQLAREHRINDNLLFTWRQRYSHRLPDNVQSVALEPVAIVPVVVTDAILDTPLLTLANKLNPGAFVTIHGRKDWPE